MNKLVIDNKVCTGCRYCEVICSMVKSGGVVNPAKSRIRVAVDTERGLARATVCRQCANPSCVEACPHYAIHQHSFLKVPIIDDTKCCGSSCLACVAACPFGAIFYDREVGKPTVCDLCGGEPMCAKFCRAYPHLPHAALRFI